MRTSSYLFFFAAALFFAGCSHENNNVIKSAKPSTGASASSANSIYLSAAPWQNQDGKSFSLKELSGKPRIIAMIFTRCGYACPRIVSDMKNLQSRLSPAERKNTGFVLVSFDTEHDLPAVLKEYAQKMDLDQNWTLLHGNEDQTRGLSVLLNLNYEKQDNGGFEHSNMITVLDASGNIAFQQEGIDATQTGLLNTIRRLEN
jgi:protein SCO1